MRSLRRPLIPLVWIVAHLMIAQSMLGTAVLCFDEDGSVSLEAWQCPCRDDHSRSPSLVGPEEPGAAGACQDIPLLTDTHLVLHGRPEAPSPPVAADHPRALGRMLARDPAGAPPAGLPLHPPSSTVHPSVRSTILLI